MILFIKPITKTLNCLCQCAGWSGPLLVANPEDRYSQVEAHISSTNNVVNSEGLQKKNIDSRL